MRKSLLPLLLLLASASSAHAAGGGKADELWRLDCGIIHANQLNEFSDTKAYTGQHRDLVASCYLIKHGDQYMLWDTGLPVTTRNAPNDPAKGLSPSLTKTIAEQLATIGVRPEQIDIIGISHYHFDHTGQAADFSKARLLIGSGDLKALRAGSPKVDPAPLMPWIKGGAAVEGISGTRNVFGDGSVMMISLPGHTPGHHGLIVKLRKTGTVLLSGDVAHFHENLDSLGVPPFNTNRAASIASMKKYRRLAAAPHTIAIIQHDPRDVAKLPLFPKGAE